MNKAYAYKLFSEADDQWSDALHAMFGKDACHVRYTADGKGKPGTVLRNLYETRDLARQMWEQAK